MKPVDFHLHRPGTLEEAVTLLAEHADEAKILAGGQSLVPLLNFRLARPEHVIDLGRLDALRTIVREQDELHVGAMVTHARAGRSPVLSQDAPLLVTAVPHIAHQPIRVRGTVGGSIAHADPAAELPAVIRALDAEIVATGPDGTRRIPAAEFFVGNLMTTLRPEEILTGLVLRRAAPGTGAEFCEVGRRQGDFALVGAGAQVTVVDQVITEARIAVIGASPVPHRAVEAERLLVGGPANATTVDSVADAVRATIDPSGDLHATADYRRDVAGVLVGRAVTAAAQRAAAAASQPA